MSIISTEKEYVELVHPSVAKLRRQTYIRKGVLGQRLPYVAPASLEGFEAEIAGLIQGDFSEQFKKRLTLQSWHEKGDIVTYSDMEEARTCVIEELRRPIEGPRYARVSLHLVEKNANTLVLRYNPTLGRWNRLCLPRANPDSWSMWNQKQSKPYGNPWRGNETNWNHLNGTVGSILVNEGSGIVMHPIGDYSVQVDKMSGGRAIQSACNWVLDKANHKFSYEFYLDDDNEEHSPTVIADDNQTTFWSIIYWDTGDPTKDIYDLSISNDTANVKKGADSLKIQVVSGTHYNLYLKHDYSPAVDWSGMDFVAFWWYGANTGYAMGLRMTDSAGNWSKWNFTDNFSGWKRFVFPLRKPHEQTATAPNLSSIARVEFLFWSTKTIGWTWNLDRLLIDVGKWVKLEVFVPDFLKDAADSFKLYCYNVSTGAYDLTPITFNAEKNISPSWNNNRIKFLNGTLLSDVRPGDNLIATYGKGSRGQTIPHSYSGSQDPNGQITYSNNYGCKYRIGFALYMPPDDGQDSSTYGISQCRLKLEISYDKGDSGLWGEATFEFTDTTDYYYGIRILEKRYILLWHTSGKRANFIILPNNALGDGEPNRLEITADENEDVARVVIGWSVEKTGDLKYGLDLTDPSLDTDNDGIPDVIENIESYVGG